MPTNVIAPFDIRDARAQAGSPAGSARMHRFPSQIRAKLVKRDGKSFYEVDGYASVFNVWYEMWDAFGPYKEKVSPEAFDTTLDDSPDVAFLLNHRGMTMARTSNGTLDLFKDETGLGVHGLLNAERQDVRDLASAIDDKLITEMSFAFMLNEGSWNDSYDHFTIKEADINRGDVSAVNYGASPYTSIEARAQEYLADTERLPLPVARAALSRLSVRLHEPSAADPDGQAPEPAREALEAPHDGPGAGSSLWKLRRRFMALDER